MGEFCTSTFNKYFLKTGNRLTYQVKPWVGNAKLTFFKLDPGQQVCIKFEPIWFPMDYAKTIYILSGSLTLYIPVTPNCIFGKQWRPRWNVTSCSISSVSTLFAQTKQSSEKEIQFYLEVLACQPSKYIMDHAKFIVSNQKEESNRA